MASRLLAVCLLTAFVVAASAEEVQESKGCSCKPCFPTVYRACNPPPPCYCSPELTNLRLSGESGAARSSQSGQSQAQQGQGQPQPAIIQPPPVLPVITVLPASSSVPPPPPPPPPATSSTAPVAPLSPAAPAPATPTTPGASTTNPSGTTPSTPSAPVVPSNPYAPSVPSVVPPTDTTPAPIRIEHITKIVPREVDVVYVGLREPVKVNVDLLPTQIKVTQSVIPTATSQVVSPRMEIIPDEAESPEINLQRQKQAPETRINLKLHGLVPFFSADTPPGPAGVESNSQGNQGRNQGDQENDEEGREGAAGTVIINGTPVKITTDDEGNSSFTPVPSHGRR